MSLEEARSGISKMFTVVINLDVECSEEAERAYGKIMDR